ncbi:hypothetical protein EU546_07215 [Candidatus Thorarchaeota archaeon]|nr:MAG: hypothetical protein EU546_07215 [Candidatus Thorarchaeota archaeon]
MPEIPPDIIRNALPLSWVLGLLYLITGVLQVGISIGLLPVVMGMTDLLGAILLLVVSAVFMTGIKHLRKGEREGVSFLVVGIIIAGLVCGVQLVIIGTGALGWFLGFEDWSGWTLQQNLTPSVWLFLLTLGVLGISHLSKRFGKTEMQKLGGQAA